MRFLCTVVMVLSLSGFASVGWAEPKVGKVTTIEFVEGMKRGNRYKYEFTLPIQQGDRFRFRINPVGDAHIPTAVRIVKPNQRGDRNAYEESDSFKTLDYTMKFVPGGNTVRIQILSPDLGAVMVEIIKVEIDKPETKNPTNK